MDLFRIFESKIRAIVESSDIVDVTGIDPAIIERINAEPPRDPEHGDVATNAAKAQPVVSHSTPAITPPTSAALRRTRVFGMNMYTKVKARQTSTYGISRPE